jgi:hypothetical protein
MDKAQSTPLELHPDRANVARIYDYYLGGSLHFAADRRVAEHILTLCPAAKRWATSNREFLGRAIRHLAHIGVRQFLDIGSGLPTAGNVHEIAQNINAAARVVYVDLDAAAVAHGRELLAGNELATAIEGDLRCPEAILAHPEVGALLDFNQPIAVVMVAVLHFIPDSDNPVRLVRHVMDAVPSGSYLVASHAALTEQVQSWLPQARELYRQASAELQPRTKPEFTALIHGLELSEPGVVPVLQWPQKAGIAEAESLEMAAVWAAIGRQG